MDSGPSQSSRRTGGRALPAIIAGTVLVVVLALLAFPRIERLFLLQASARGETTLRLAVEGLTGALDRYKSLPALIAERPQLVQLLRDPDNEGLLPFVNEQFRQTAFRVGASDVYLMDISGMTIAASNYRKPLSFVGRNFAFRPYFTQALEGGMGQFFALGTTSGERGYFFAAPVLADARIVGVVALKFTVDSFEDSWRGGEGDILVKDRQDVVFMSSRPDWQFRALGPLDDAATDWIARTRQYPLDAVKVIDTSETVTDDGIRILSIEDDPQSPYIVVSQRIPEAGWTVSHLLPVAPIRTEALMVLSAMALVLLVAGLITAQVLLRRAQIRERLTAQARAQELAETQVTLRTAELHAANAALTREVEERRAAEERLRKTQAELVQAGKLAALGQMSAALSHEINQPLAAVKSYAENASTFLDRGRTAEARDNIGRISEMADRMSAISRHLRNFARRPQEKIGPIPVLQVIDDAIALMGSRLKSEGARIAFDRPQSEVWATGGAVRLQQVVVNLLSNALDAMKGADKKVVGIAVDLDDARVAIHVRDTGAGIDEAAMPRIFDPFYSTKTPGSGLGLGLSISYNIIRDFGGRLSAANLPEGGAEFRIDLDRAMPNAPREMVAE